MRRYRGFTLVELTVVIALLGIVGLLMMRLMFFSSRQYTRIDQEITANEEARLLSDYVVSEVHRHDVSQGVSFTVSGSSVFLQIHDSETPFMVEGEAYAYQWMRVTSHDVDGVPRETIEIGFGKIPDDLLSTTWYDVLETEHITDITWANAITREIEGQTVLKSFDFEIEYMISDTTSEKSSETVTIRSEI